MDHHSGNLGQKTTFTYNTALLPYQLLEQKTNVLLRGAVGRLSPLSQYHGSLHIKIICGRWRVQIMQLFILTPVNSIKRTEGAFPFDSSGIEHCIPSVWPRSVVITSCRLRDWLCLTPNLVGRTSYLTDHSACDMWVYLTCLPLTQRCVRQTLPPLTEIIKATT